ncbi:S-adenosyl-L-methionine hydrolase (adenosine-forming) (SAM hydrolase (adenosine-forming)) (S-adenosyl-L-methionine:hydroxide adenosyltransferase) (SAM hydroxide adenosyltransferase) [Durusdinium trenchii]|uniref:S-adenosyl-L-methionine hydrolase (Adenosine-forming) (SAM hydrolase (Adenosine-forming)) (S-adenosyl-L-methionine:hydroxide adenosyltransferase) (SAM hydroxide adenosyltransferase) n=2 Tax=Durusdinium trenchii TaxID=1381693 RepID=A0ABP0Q4Z1_9DINO
MGLALAGVVHFTMQPSVEFPLPTGQLFAVSTEANQATFDLPFDGAKEQYLLVVSNVASELEPRNVSLDIASIEEATRMPFRQVASLDPTPLPSDPNFYASLEETNEAFGPQDENVCRKFWVHVGGSESENPASYREINAELQAQGPHIRVFVDRDDRLPQETAETIVELFENSIRPTAAEKMGLPHDVDGDGTFAVLVTGWLGKLDAGTVSLGGMVNPNDYDSALEKPYSNHADVLYLNSNVRPGRHLATLMAHEFAHAISSSGRQQHRTLLFAGGSEESWLSEAISHVAENLESDNWTNLDHRVARFLQTPEETPLVVPNYRSAGLWRAAGPRGSTYLFLRWCVDHYGTGLLPALIYSGRSGVANLEAATGEPFDELYRRFAADLFLRTIETSDGSSCCATCVNLPRIDLASPLGEWGLAGPRYESLEVDNSVATDLQLCGTTSRYFVVSANGAGPRRIRIAAELGSQLQVTVVRLPDELPRLRLKTLPTDPGKWKLALSESSGTPLELCHVAWEDLGDSPVDPSPQCLADDELSTMFDDACVPGGRRRRSGCVATLTIPVICRNESYPVSEPLITLTTDFGEGSAYVAAMKGVIYSICPNARVVDISHRVPPQDVRLAALMHEDATPWFPPGTIHVAVIDPGVGTKRGIVFAEIGQQRYVCPDNGLLSRLVLREPATQLRAVENPKYWLPEVSATFHGRDIMGPVAAWVAGGVDPAELGPELGELQTLEWPEPEVSANEVQGVVLVVDPFGNLISNITAACLPEKPLESLRVSCGGQMLDGVVRTYGERPAGTLVALFGSTGRLEVAVVDGSAAAELGVRVLGKASGYLHKVRPPAPLGEPAVAPTGIRVS